MVGIDFYPLDWMSFHEFSQDIHIVSDKENEQDP